MRIGYIFSAILGEIDSRITVTSANGIASAVPVVFGTPDLS